MIGRESLFALAKALEGLPVLGALSGTPAARAGIRYGDVLISVNGRRVKNVVDYVEAKALDENGMQVVVFRTGTERMEELHYEKSAPSMNPTAILAELQALRIAPGSTEEDLDRDEPGSKAGVRKPGTEGPHS